MKILSLGNNSNKVDKIRIDANIGHSQKFSQQNPNPQSSNLLNDNGKMTVTVQTATIDENKSQAQNNHHQRNSSGKNQPYLQSLA